MDIVCAKTGRHFNGVEAVRECANTHNRCSTCPWDKAHSNTPTQFTTRGANIITQQEIDKLMADINAHLTREPTQQMQPRARPRPASRLEHQMPSPNTYTLHKQKKSLLPIILVLGILIVITLALLTANFWINQIIGG